MTHVTYARKKFKKSSPNVVGEEDDDFMEVDEPKEPKKKPTKPTRPKKIYGSDFNCQSKGKGIVELIQKFTEKQKDDIKSIGFGGFLHLKLSMCSNHDMLKWLVKCFNASSRMLEIDSVRGFSITPDDVHDVFMLPRNPGAHIVKRQQNEESSFRTLLKNEYGIEASVPIRILFNALDTRFSNGGDDFKRVFVLYVMSSFLFPTANRNICIANLNFIEDVNEISKLDWCSIVLDKLCEAVDSYKQNNTTYVNGCVQLLQIIYFHRLTWKGISEPSTLPLIQHWTESKLGERCKQEKKASKYGSGVLVSGIYLVSLNAPVAGKVVEKGAEKEAEKGVNQKTICSPYDDAEMEITKDMLEFLSSLKKDSIAFVDKYISRLRQISQEHQYRKDKKASLVSSPILSEMDKFFMDNNVLKAITVFENTFEMTRRLAISMPNFNLLTPDPIDTSDYGWNSSNLRDALKDFCGVDLGDDYDVEVDLGADCDVGVDVRVDCDVGDVGVDLHDDRDGVCVDDGCNKKGGVAKNNVHDEGHVIDKLDGFEGDQQIDVPVVEEESREAILSVSSLAEQFGIDSSIFFSEIKKEIGYLSKYMNFSKRFLGNMPQYHKELIDICFCNWHRIDTIEQFFFYDPLVFVAKEDVLTLDHGRWISSFIISAWSVIINHDCWLDKCRSRFIFNSNYSGVLEDLIHDECNVEEKFAQLHQFWEGWLLIAKDTTHLVDMIFLPYCVNSHYVAVAINFVDKKIQYLNNMKY